MSKRWTPDHVKAQVIANLVQGMGWKEASEAAGIRRGCLWEWRKHDPVFQEMLEEAQLTLSRAIVDEAVREAVARARALSPKAIERIERGLNITHVNKAMTVSKGRGKSVVEIHPVPDDAVAAELALKFLKFIQEFQPRQEIELSGNLEHRLADLGDDGPSD